jgi:hypothetical protein
MKTAIVFLCKEIKQGTIAFANDIALKNFAKVHIVSDEVSLSDWNWVENTTHLYTKHLVKDIACINDGYVGCNINETATHIQKKVIAYDKFLWIFANKFCKYDNVWVFEDDCFIPSIDALKNLIDKYKEYDLVTPNNFLKTDNVLDWHWKHIVDKIEAPYYHSMVCAAKFSNRMLSEIKRYVDKNKQLFHIEAMFNTIAMQKGLKVTDANELKSVVWMGEWVLDHFVQLPNNIFHPVKDIENHKENRTDINTAKVLGYKPTKELPDFLKF